MGGEVQRDIVFYDLMKIKTNLFKHVFCLLKMSASFDRHISFMHPCDHFMSSNTMKGPVL